MRLLYATDLHGNRKAIEQALDLARREKVGAVVFGGDLTAKFVAFKLKDGKVIPADMLSRDQAEGTYLPMLERVKVLNQRLKPAELAEYLDQTGTAVVAEDRWDLDEVMAEQTLLHKLFQCFRYRSTALELTPREEELVRTRVVEWFSKLESAWGETKRKEFAARCRGVLGGKGEFADFAPSRRIVDCILLGGDPLRLSDAQQYRAFITPDHIVSVAEYSAASQLQGLAHTPSFVGEAQGKFLTEQFLPLLRRWKEAHPGIAVYSMLGNDDVIEHLEILNRAEDEGVLLHLHGKVQTLTTGWKIVGYEYVEGLPDGVGYDAWVKTPDQIHSDLIGLHKLVGGQSAVWVIHHPPRGHLDLTEVGPAGSEGVRKFINEVSPRLALFGHIHEAPRLGGAYTSRLGSTLCVNPGGEHTEGLQAVLIDTETLIVERKE